MKTPAQKATEQTKRIRKLKESEKVIIYIIESYSVCFLIPKKRSDGYLKVPIGHHVDPLSSEIHRKTGYESTGIDGYIEVDTGWTMNKDYSNVVKVISDYYGWPCKLVDRNWWFDQLQNK